MPAKTLQLQVRVTAQQKAALRRHARAAGLGMSEYVLARALPAQDRQFSVLVRALGTASDHRPLLAELNDLLNACAPADFSDLFGEVTLTRLTPYLANYVAAMTEQAAHQKRLVAPAWTRDVRPLDEPQFATGLSSLRMHLLRSAPVPFKRRNIFVDAGVGARV